MSIDVRMRDPTSLEQIDSEAEADAYYLWYPNVDAIVAMLVRHPNSVTVRGSIGPEPCAEQAD